ncbi:imidazole glycerol phosphate synthase subunit HisH [Candidatus Micrarchaeota archaeon]|nr:imidazole glycerol phosphate synthase subunit HisH [Candidatus Micrarchaeota archaeon]
MIDIAIIDYNAGNTINVKNAFGKLGANVVISDSPFIWEKADGIIFPGVGYFGSAVRNLDENAKLLKDLITKKKVPFFGICLGMQLLMDKSDESPEINGLGIIPGQVCRFEGSYPIPQIGWNKVEQLNSPLFDGLDDFYAYFAHSYYCDPTDKTLVAATTKYGEQFSSAFWKENIFAVQFHPEKSGELGLKILKNFLNEVRK